ncbi:MAG: DUF3137 domain-containing protein [Phycisphaerales bacterium]|nr:DUF3137 domain-containing protein [Phycisphaerales bacterium]
MGLIDDVIIEGIQFLFFKMKNNSRAKAFDAFAKANNLNFNAKANDYVGEIMQMETPSGAQAKAMGGRRMSVKARCASRWFGDSPLQTKLWAFVSNRMRGDWQTNCNIMEGQWKGHLMTTFDTLWFEPGNSTHSEGEYTSVFAHCKASVPQVLITPTGLLSALKRADEGQLLNFGYHKMQFESTDFNKTWRVSAVEERQTYDFISQSMMEYLLDHRKEKWHIEMSPGGILISTVYTLKPAQVEQAMDFLAGFLEHVDSDLLQPA